MDSMRDGETEIGVDTVQNSTVESYTPPLRWTEFPLSHTSPKVIDTQNDVSFTSTWERTINDDDGTLTSGSDGETMDVQYVCINKVSKRTDAGTFDTYWMKEKVLEDSPRNLTTDYYYSEDVGFWVVKDVFVIHEGSEVRIKHYELTDWTTNGQPEIEEEPTIIMDEDSFDGSIDLDDIFSDPDLDPLEFDIVETGPFTLEIDEDNRLLISPPEDGFGSWNISVSATDGVHDPVELTIPVTIIAVDDPPELFDPDLDPQEGSSEDIFTFSISSRDIDSGLPASAKVHVGTTRYDLTRTSGENSTGMILEWSGTLQVGDHSHYFIVDGTRFPSSGEIEGPAVTAPLEPFIESGTVDLEEGGLNTQFSFEMVWIGPNGEEPEGSFLVIDDVRYEMDEGSGSAVSGLDFEITKTLTEGTNSFHFEADLDGTTYRFPSFGGIQGPTVHSPEIIDFGYVHLKDSRATAEYLFYVNYRHLADVDPTTVTVIIDGNERDIFDQVGDAMNGINFTREMDITEGSHSIEFRIEADGAQISSDQFTLEVIIDDTTGDPSSPASTDKTDNGSLITWVIIGSLILIIVGGILFFMLRKKSSRAEEAWTEYDREMDEEP